MSSTPYGRVTKIALYATNNNNHRTVKSFTYKVQIEKDLSDEYGVKGIYRCRSIEDEYTWKSGTIKPGAEKRGAYIDIPSYTPREEEIAIYITSITYTDGTVVNYYQNESTADCEESRFALNY